MTFEEIFRTHIKREGSAELLKWLKSTDFFTAPGSTRFHDCYSGGLAEHSARVFNELVRLLKAYPEVKVSATWTASRISTATEPFSPVNTAALAYSLSQTS